MTNLPVQVHLNSEHAFQQGDAYHNDCTFNSMGITAPMDHGIYVSLQSLTLPHTMLVVNSYCNTLTVNSAEYTLTPGNYDCDTLAAALAALLPCTVAYDSITLKLTLSSSTSMTVSGTLCSVLGLDSPSTGTSLSSKYTLDLTGLQSIYLLTDSYNTGNVDTRPAANLNVIARIPVSVAPGSIIDYQPNNAPGFWIQNGDLQLLRILLEDDKRRPLQASLYWEATLRIDFVPTGVQRMQRQQPTDIGDFDM